MGVRRWCSDGVAGRGGVDGGRGSLTGPVRSTLSSKGRADRQGRPRRHHPRAVAKRGVVCLRRVVGRAGAAVVLLAVLSLVCGGCMAVLGVGIGVDRARAEVIQDDGNGERTEGTVELEGGDAVS